MALASCMCTRSLRKLATSIRIYPKLFWCRCGQLRRIASKTYVFAIRFLSGVRLRSALGVCIWVFPGPGRGEHSWDKPLAKYETRVGMWKCKPLGMHYTAKVYNALVFSTFSFVWQITDVPVTALAAEKTALRKLTPGPGMWRLPADLSYLREFFGQALSFEASNLLRWLQSFVSQSWKICR